MPIVTLEAAKLQLNIIDNDEDILIEPLISAAIGMVEHSLQRDIYEQLADVPEGTTNAIVFNDLKETKKSALEMAIKLALSTLYTYRDSEIDIDLSVNPAFTACLSGFSCVVVG